MEDNEEIQVSVTRAENIPTDGSGSLVNNFEMGYEEGVTLKVRFEIAWEAGEETDERRRARREAFNDTLAAITIISGDTDGANAVIAAMRQAEREGK